MSAFNLVRNGLALIAGAALLETIFEELGGGSSKYSETDAEKNYRECADKMADLKIAAAEKKISEKHETEIKNLQEKLEKLKAKLQELSEEDDACDAGKDIEDEQDVEDAGTDENEETVDYEDLKEKLKTVEKMFDDVLAKKGE